MKKTVIRFAAASMLIGTLAACTQQPVTAPPGPSPSNVNPVTGVRGGANGPVSGGVGGNGVMNPTRP